MASAKPTERRWTWWRLLGYTVAIGAVFLFTEIAALTMVIGPMGLRGDPDGFAVSVATIAAACTTVPSIWFLTRRCELRPWAFLGVKRPPSRAILIAVAATVLFIAASDLLTLSLGRPLVPPFMTDAYASARVPALLFIALTVAAPISEELMFRGLLFGGLRACGASLMVAGALVSIAFASLHLQYDLYGILTGLGLAVMLLATRIYFDSIVPSIVMHSLANAVGYAEAALLQR